MKFTTNKKELLHDLIECSRVIPVRTTLPILSCTLIEATNKTITIRTTDLEQTIIVNHEAKTIEEGEIAIPFNKLFEIINALKDGPLEISGNSENEIEINTNTGIYRLSGKTAEEFPEIPKLKGNNNLNIKGSNLLQIINNTTYAVSKDDLKPALCGVYLNISNNKITAVATDGHRLVKHEQTTEEKEQKTESLIVPGKFFNILKNSIKPDNEININIGENHIDIKQKNSYLITRIIKETFPDFNSVIPEKSTSNTTINTERLISSLKRVSIFSNKTTKQVQIQFSKNELTLSTQDKETKASAKEHIECEHVGEEIITQYNAQYLKEVLIHLSSEEIGIFLTSSQAAAVFKPIKTEKKDQIKQTALLMPLRTNS